MSAFVPFGQCASPWGPHPLGWINPGTICQYGCYDDCFAMVANDSGHPCTPGTLDELFTAKKIFVKDSTGTYDLLPDNALDLAFPGDYQSQGYAGFRADLIKAAIPAPDTYAIVQVHGYSPYWGINILSHFVLCWSADGTLICDAQDGRVRALSGYGGPTHVEKTIIVKRLRPAPPPPPPPPKPVPTPPPPPTFNIAFAGVIIAQGLNWTDAVTGAQTRAKANPGKLYEVRNVAGDVLDTEFVALPPAPVPPKPLPVPTPAPPHVGQFDIWGAIQTIIIVLILDFRGITNQGKSPHPWVRP